MVLTKTGLRVYNASNGRLIKIIQGFVDDHNVHLSSMTLDVRHRKLYIGDTSGVVRVINVTKGAEMGQLELASDIRSHINETDPTIDRNISSLKFLKSPMGDEDMLVTGQGNSRVSVWDVSTAEGSEMLRSTSGGAVLTDNLTAIAAS